ncbi:MAG: NAD(P)/FAD-dependent oxidoreductase [bacterium]
MECVVVGAGVVGLAVAAELARAGREVVVLEQHNCIGSETSSRNSEVIHAGIYYPQGSRKAELCVRGKHMLYRYCDRFGVPYKQCGKVIVAADPTQVETVKGYIEKAAANGVDDLRWLSAAEIAEMEPEVSCVGGVLSPSTGIIDSHAFMLALQGELEHYGGMIAFQTHVRDVRSRNAERQTSVQITTSDFELQADWFINCAGLHAPALAAGTPDAPRAYYAKGHYYAYSGRQPFSRLVYPVAQTGGLGVHVTLDLAGQIKFGPDVRWIDGLDYSFDESHFDDFVAAIRSYYPALDEQRLHPSYTGIRPKIAPPDGGFQDFRIEGPSIHGVPGWINLLGIESPGLTASLAIAEEVASQVQ